MTGVGDRIEPLPLDQTIHLVLIFPDFACPTGQVYATFDRLHDRKPYPEPDRQQVRQLAQQRPLAANGPQNDLARAAYAVRPELKRIADDLQTKLQIPVHVTGSGSTLYMVAPSAAACDELARHAAATVHLPVVATRTLALAAP